MNIELKKKIIKTLCTLRVDAFCRTLNRDRLLVVTYHGIYNKLSDDGLSLFTHLHVDLFRQHLQFLEKHYNVISYPILQELNQPAVIFLTTDYVGTENLLWFDELYLLLRQFEKVKYDLNVVFLGLDEICRTEGTGAMYKIVSEQFKKMSNIERARKIFELKKLVDISLDPFFDHFKLLNWNQIQEMQSSGLVEFGVHTANHRILSGLAEDELEMELVDPKAKLEDKLNCEIISFCYPNGIPDVDFFSSHEGYLASNGYLCAFSTQEELNSRDCNPYRLGRLAIGSDITSDMNFFRLNVSGLLSLFR